jgi:pyruvate/2-oxoglutarate dehydrogenase complex dihydrolipoamide acyltransferase (E2) component
MPQTLAMPKLGLTMTEGQVAEWRRAPGESFAAGDVLVVIETDKIANDLEAPAAGRLTEILVEAGQTVPVGTPLARWEPAEGATVATSSQAQPVSEAAAAPLVTSSREETAATAVPVPATTGQRIVATPYARRLAGERGVKLRSLIGSGPGGRIRAADVPERATAPQAVAAPVTAAVSAEHFLVADVSARALLDWRAALPAGQGGIGSLVFYLAARTLMASRPQALCAAGDGAPLPAGAAAQGLVAWQAARLGARPDGPPAQLWFASAGRGPLRMVAPARPAGCDLALGVGSLVEGRLTLALRADAAVWSAAQAADFLTQLHGALEDPRRLLL